MGCDFKINILRGRNLRRGEERKNEGTTVAIKKKNLHRHGLAMVISSYTD